MEIKEIIKQLQIVEFQLKKQKLQECYLFYIQPIKNTSIRNRVVRILFGRNKPGLVQKLNGIRISSSTFIIPSGQHFEVKSFLELNKIKVSTYKIWKEK